MELTDNDLNQIESYFNQTLSDIDRMAFENRLKTDADFKKAAFEYQATVAVLNTVREREKRDFLSKINATMPPVMVPVSRPNFRIWAMAAAVLLMVSVGFWLFKNGDDGVKLKSPVADCFEAYPSLNSIRGVEQKDNKMAAFEAYNAQKYAKAAVLFGKAFTENQDTILLFYKGIAELGGGKSQGAVTNLAQLNGSNIVPQEALYFYLGLAESENNQSEKAIFWLKKAAYTEGSYQAKAQRALAVLTQKK